MQSYLWHVARVALLCSLAALAGCAAAPVREAEAAAGVPGMDTRDYPGDAVMRTWRDVSPYRWVGYYLPAPCYTGMSWTGRRASLRRMGWGFAVIYVGEQDWAAMGHASDTTPPVENPRCTRANLTERHGTAHAAAAAASAASEGFPRGTIIFLDVERVEHVSVELAAYVRSWVGELLEHGRYVPGLYAHDDNTPELYTLLAEEFLRQGRLERPRLWVAKQRGFAPGTHPARSGYPVAAIWQGIFNVRESHGGTTLLIDVNVADSADPSRGR